MPNFVTAEDALEALVSGAGASEVQPSLDQLAATDLQAVLCTACFTMEEVAANCQEWADEIIEAVTLNCSFYKAGIRTCGFSNGQVSLSRITMRDIANSGEPSNGS
jgi:hypothetical protein